MILTPFLGTLIGEMVDSAVSSHDLLARGPTSGSSSPLQLLDRDLSCLLTAIADEEGGNASEVSVVVRADLRSQEVTWGKLVRAGDLVTITDKASRARTAA